MNMKHGLAVIVLGTAMGVVGCKKEEATTPAPTPPTSATPAPAAPTTAPVAGPATLITETAKVDLTAVKAATEEKIAKAKQFLAQANSYITDKKLEQADEILKQVEAMGDSLPETLRQDIKQARTLLNAAKNAAIIPNNLPSLNK
jgi:hypothetical protein